MSKQENTVYKRSGWLSFDVSFVASWSKKAGDKTTPLIIRCSGAEFGRSKGKVNREENFLEIELEGESLEQREFLNFIAGLASEMGLGRWMPYREWHWNSSEPLKLKDDETHE